MLNSFKKSGLTFSMVNNKLAVRGINNLLKPQADIIREQIRQHKDKIIKELLKIKCSAFDQVSGKCFSYSMFNGKPGKPKPCSPKDCEIKRENTFTPKKGKSKQ